MNELDQMFNTRKLHPAPGYLLVSGAETETTRASGLIVARQHGVPRGVVVEVGDDVPATYEEGSTIHYVDHLHVGDYLLVPSESVVAYERPDE